MSTRSSSSLSETVGLPSEAAAFANRSWSLSCSASEARHEFTLPSIWAYEDLSICFSLPRKIGAPVSTP